MPSGAVSKPVACPLDRPAAVEPKRRAPRLLRAWNAGWAAWLARRLARIETQMLALRSRAGGHGPRHLDESWRQDLAIYESCCMERAVLRAQIDRCRALI